MTQTKPKGPSTLPDLAEEHVPSYERGRQRGLRAGLQIAIMALIDAEANTADIIEKGAYRRLQGILERKAQGYR